MAITNKDGQLISYECSSLIEQLKEDIKLHSGDTVVYVKTKTDKGVVLHTDYSVAKKDRYDRQMTMTALLIVLEKQNSIL